MRGSKVNRDFLYLRCENLPDNFPNDMLDNIDLFGGTPRIDQTVIDRLAWLLEDNEEAVEAVKALLFLFSSPEYCAPEPEYSAEVRDRNNAISELSGKLSELLKIEDNWGNLPDALDLMEKLYAIKANESDPEGKRPRAPSIYDDIAEQLVQFQRDGIIPIEFRTSPDSDFAKLFRLCCTAIGIRAPKNVHFYLRPYIDGSAIRKTATSGLAEEVVHLLEDTYFQD